MLFTNQQKKGKKHVKKCQKMSFEEKQLFVF